MNLRELLKKELSGARPARYTMDEREWVDQVADGIDLDAIHLDYDQAIRDYVRNVARGVEGEATKSGNRLLRQFHTEYALPGDWAQLANEPIALENVQIVDGVAVRVKERVRLRDATARDFELWAETEDKARHKDFAARGEAVAGALEIAGDMRAAGVLTFGVWAESAPVAQELAA